ncbi:hypothetical protein [Haliangium sp.]|uniref:hypothetical protein n=1 Tax=Haliangium sp. TaxID=2663208 RepID=UPI003D09D5A7
MSCLPEPWRERITAAVRLPLALGTMLSALLELGLGFAYLSHGYLTGTGVLLEYLPPLMFVLVLMWVVCEGSLRLLSAVALWTPLGTLPMWVVARLCTRWSRLTAKLPRYGLPPARLLRHKDLRPRHPVPPHL